MNVQNKWNKDEVRQLKVNDLVWVVDKIVNPSNYNMARVLEVQKGSDGSVIAATVEIRDEKIERPVMELTPLFSISVFREKTWPAMLAPVISRQEKTKMVKLAHQMSILHN